ncbi:macro domain-containing protein [Marinobacter xestospongiae]|uniref:Macro domain-containing protein n=1 Tax=Marinobacter xestospongiae TaxID=994319 RepID=A0ABU3VT31_9GAMM|nr:macro domain-containing protein [Marinobacter xestospongiae]MDV2077418.1 macro domain-containing protein [Marinobacter xestospongiae]
MATIHYLKGDATEPQEAVSGPKIIVHVCNDLGKWGRGFVLALSKRWPAPEQSYREAFASNSPPALGSVQFVAVEKSIEVANLIGQRGIARRGQKSPPIRYDAVRTGLAAVARRAMENGASVHMPRIGCGLAGGRWDRIEPLITDTLLAAGVPVTVYDF